MPLTVDESSMRQVRLRVNKIRKRVQDPSDAVWRQVGSYLSKQVDRQFITEGAHLGPSPWQPLKPAYRMWKIRHGYSRKILVQTGELRRSFTSRPMGIEEYHGQYAIFGSDLQKAVWHQYGTERHGKRVNPPRPMLVVNPDVRRDIKDILTNYIVGKRKKTVPGETI
jgi:phage virion morphogenesis protein